jgi:hypothetical protein
MIDCVNSRQKKFRIWSRSDLKVDRYLELILIRLPVVVNKSKIISTWELTIAILIMEANKIYVKYYFR